MSCVLVCLDISDFPSFYLMRSFCLIGCMHMPMQFDYGLVFSPSMPQSLVDVFSYGILEAQVLTPLHAALDTWQCI